MIRKNKKEDISQTYVKDSYELKEEEEARI